MNSIDLEDLEGAGGITKNMSALRDTNGDPITFEIIDKETSLGRQELNIDAKKKKLNQQKIRETT